MAGERDTWGALARDLTVLVLAAAMLVGWAVVSDRGEQTEAGAEPVSYSAMPPSEPTRLVVPSLGVRAPLVPIEVTPEGVLPPPEDANTVGWWRRSAKPGARSGQTVVTGHTLSQGKGALDRLPEVKKGAFVDLVTERGRMRYRVKRVVVLSYDEVARRAADLFAQDRQRGRLVLLTCTDFDGRVYRSNVIVFGTPMGRPQT